MVRSTSQQIVQSPAGARTGVMRFAIATGLVAAFIVYGCLYPFAFHAAFGGGEALGALLSTWDRPPPNRGDLIANILLYVPFGLFAALSMRRCMPALVACIAATAAGTLLSIGLEFAQLFVHGRTSSMADLYLNAAGSLCGAAVALVISDGSDRLFRERTALRLEPIPLLLIACWLGFRLYPYVPVIDLHAYLDSLKPIAVAPHIEPYDVFRSSVVWLTIGHLVERLIGRGRVLRLAPIGIAGLFGAEIVIAGNVLLLSDILGAGVALLAWRVLRHERPRAVVLTGLVLIVVIAWRLEPFAVAATPQAFGWIPFASLLHGSLESGLQSILQKVFLYGCLLWLFLEIGLGLLAAIGLEMILLFATSVVQTWIPGRSAEITDTAMVALIGLTFLSLADGVRFGTRRRIRRSAGRRDTEWDSRGVVLTRAGGASATIVADGCVDRRCGRLPRGGEMPSDDTESHFL